MPGARRDQRAAPTRQGGSRSKRRRPPDAFVRVYGLANNPVDSPEIRDGQVRSADILNGSITGADLAPSANPAAFSTAVGDTGIICNGGCVEGSRSLPAGAYAITAKIELVQGDTDQ